APGESREFDFSAYSQFFYFFRYCFWKVRKPIKFSMLAEAKIPQSTKNCRMACFCTIAGANLTLFPFHSFAVKKPLNWFAMNNFRP
ncbi:MAG TPA: hypothetical protein VHA37_01045, partial [Candidatus Saccharimonadales bacterium]|nr:hypothetical protein [Candidatus Saccharimonadales bacterium]